MAEFDPSRRIFIIGASTFVLGSILNDACSLQPSNHPSMIDQINSAGEIVRSDMDLKGLNRWIGLVNFADLTTERQDIPTELAQEGYVQRLTDKGLDQVVILLDYGTNLRPTPKDPIPHLHLLEVPSGSIKWKSEPHRTSPIIRIEYDVSQFIQIQGQKTVPVAYNSPKEYLTKENAVKGAIIQGKPEHLVPILK